MKNKGQGTEENNKPQQMNMVTDFGIILYYIKFKNYDQI